MGSEAPGCTAWLPRRDALVVEGIQCWGIHGNGDGHINYMCVYICIYRYVYVNLNKSFFFLYTCDMNILNAYYMVSVVLYSCQMVIDDLGAWCRPELQLPADIFWLKEDE